MFHVYSNDDNIERELKTEETKLRQVVQLCVCLVNNRFFGQNAEWRSALCDDLRLLASLVVVWRTFVVHYKISGSNIP